MRRLIFALVLLSCASPGMPPGGPEDRLPPELVTITPDSGALNAQPRQVVFRFDEVVSERPVGVPALDRLFLISPRDGEPKVDWRRSAIAVRPRRGWRPNTVYTVTMLPGLADLRSNARKQGATVLFSTGAAIPDTRITGIVFDWIAGKPAPRAAIEAIATDSTIYVASADSTGRFEMAHLPLGKYTVRGYMDANSNRSVDSREAWDSLGIVLTGTASVELLAFVHDTIGPRINTVTVQDSVTLRVNFDKPIHPNQVIEPALFRLMTADSAPLPILSAQSAKSAELARAAAEKAKQDSARARDTTARLETPRVPLPVRNAARRDTTPVPTPSRPIPEAELTLKLGNPIATGVSYRLRAIEIQGLLGIRRTSDRVFTQPKPKAPTKADSLALTPGGTRADSLRRAAPSPADTTRRPPPATADTTRRPPPATADTTRRPPRA